jgi:IclR family transcriptional regulator, KDG regulon repressor
MKEKSRYYRIGSLEKGIRIIELLSHQGTLTLSEVAAKLKLDRSVCHRHLLTLRDLGWVSQQGGAGYQLTMTLFEMAMRVVNRLEIVKIVRPFLEDLSREYQETVNLGLREGNQIVFVDKILSTHLFRADLSVGTRHPLHCTALGKAVLAFRPKAEQDAICKDRKLKASSEKSIISGPALRQELAAIRDRGFAIDDEEYYLGLRAVAAPLVDHTGYALYAVSIAGPSQRLNIERLMEIGPDLKQVCEKVSSILGERRT